MTLLLNFLNSLITVRIQIVKHPLCFSAEEMLHEKDEEDGHLEIDEEHSDEETQTQQLQWRKKRGG